MINWLNKKPLLKCGLIRYFPKHILIIVLEKSYSNICFKNTINASKFSIICRIFKHCTYEIKFARKCWSYLNCVELETYHSKRVDLLEANWATSIQTKPITISFITKEMYNQVGQNLRKNFYA